jgi:DNA-binding transcriptional LysR family regulator
LGADVLDLHRLRLLRELRRRGTVSAVAQAFSYSPSAISQQLATLERETGVRLLEPAGRRLRLTAQGEVLVEHAEVLLEQVERAEAALARSVKDISGTLRVASFQTAVMALLPAALTRLAEQHPALRVEVTELEPEVALPAMVAGEFDLVIAEEYPGQSLPRLKETDRTDLLSDELVLVVPSGWGARGLTDVTDRPFVVEPVSTAAGQWALTTCRAAGFEPDVRYRSTDLGIHLRLVREGLAVALLPELAGPREVDAVAVERLKHRPARTIFAAARRGATEQPAVRAFCAAVTQARVPAPADEPRDETPFGSATQVTAWSGASPAGASRDDRLCPRCLLP